MIERYDLAEYCRSKFYQVKDEENVVPGMKSIWTSIIVNLKDNLEGDQKSLFDICEFKEKGIEKEMPSEKRDDSSELQRLTGFFEYICKMVEKHKILTKRTLTELSEDEKEMYGRDYDFCVSYVWNKSNKDKIFRIIKLRNLCECNANCNKACRDKEDILWNQMLSNIDTTSGKKK